ncbi:hypothetical protein EVAR_59655_1 [Eumeta japonica]|uniref:Uncharacterized protein n=1 Tax=Eumeta variegata TaxID=151549 RepID=A0A4C1YZG5_EUMVA|nr:hypothetical protein EVAR_59655_1 [Eumeta japonica]
MLNTTLLQVTKAGFTVTIPKPKQSAQGVSPFEELPFKVKQVRSFGKKMVASFFGQYGTIVFENKKKQSLQTGILTIVCLLFRKQFGKNDFTLGFSVIMTTPHHILPVK